MRMTFLSIVMLGMLSIGAAGQAGATVVVQRDSSIGRQAASFFSVSKTVTCGGVQKTASLFGNLFGAQSIARSTGVPVTRENAIVVDVFGYSNECTGASFGFGSGNVVGGLVGPGPLLTLATMNNTATIQDVGSGATASVTVHATFTSAGPLVSSGSTTETHTVTAPGGPFTITITRTANSNRPANVTGTFAINGDVFNLAGSTGTFNSNSNSTFTVTKP